MKLRRPTKRTLLLLLLFLVGGAIINVAVAWGPAIRKPYRRFNNIDPAPLTPTEWSFFAIRQPTLKQADIYVCERDASFGYTQIAFQFPRGTDNDSKDKHVVAWLRFGWPMFSMQSEFCLWKDLPFEEAIRLRTADDQKRTYLVPHEGNLRTSVFGRPMAFALKPIPLGFAINTIFYAAVLWVIWLLFTAPGFVRRHIRIMRHRCPACGYLIGTSPVCTECGVPLGIQKS